MGAIELVKDKKTRKTFDPGRRYRHDLPRPLLPARPGDAGDPRHHADLAAADLDQGDVDEWAGLTKQALASPRKDIGSQLTIWVGRAVFSSALPAL
jgi:hypothetical protein